MNRDLSSPCLQSPAPPAPGHKPWALVSMPRHPAGRKPGILVVDDKALVLALLEFELRQYDFSVWLALDGRQAIRLYQRLYRNIDLVLLDVRMPDLDGPQTLGLLQ